MNCCKHWINPIIVCAGMFLSVSGSACGADPQQLTDDGANKRDPIFVEEGKSLIYCYDETPDFVRMMKMNMETLEIVEMFEDAGNHHHYEPAFSADGRYTCYTECTGNLTARLVIRDLQNEKPAAFITHSGRGGTRNPIFTPDSKTVIYAFAETGPQQLWSCNLEGKNKKQMTHSEGITNWPTVTPDGKRVIFSNSRENNYEIYSMNLDGTDEKRLTTNRLMDVRPAVSPDGKRIAFVSTRDGNYDIYVMNIDGSNVHRITTSEERDDYPRWHPNSQQIVFVGEREGEFNLYLLDIADDISVAAK